MKYNLLDKDLTIFFTGHLNTDSVGKVEEEVKSIVSENEYEKLILDFKDLEYISSVGLRLILKLKQNIYYTNK